MSGLVGLCVETMWRLVGSWVETVEARGSCVEDFNRLSGLVGSCVETMWRPVGSYVEDMNRLSGFVGSYVETVEVRGVVCLRF